MSNELEDNSYYADYQVIHFHNRQDVFHLTSQILRDTAASHGEYCFFYRILTDDTDAFNRDYGSFATIIPRTQVEADVYLNVDQASLQTLIRYIQTDSLMGCTLTSDLADLSYVFGLSALATSLRELL